MNDFCFACCVLTLSRFRSSHSVLTCSLKCANDRYLNIYEGEYTFVPFIDHKKAFDTVDHQTLSDNSKVYGQSGKEIAWFMSYLGNRKQYCRVNGLTAIKLGASQGFCLYPLLS